MKYSSDELYDLRKPISLFVSRYCDEMVDQEDFCNKLAEALNYAVEQTSTPENCSFDCPEGRRLFDLIGERDQEIHRLKAANPAKPNITITDEMLEAGYNQMYRGESLTDRNDALRRTYKAMRRLEPCEP